jgi:hypothetical protein
VNPNAAEGTRRAGAVILVEGMSDKIVVETLAARQGRDLNLDEVVVVSMSGAHAIGRYLAAGARTGGATILAGLCDAGEEDVLRASLERAGLGRQLTRQDMERLGFYLCVEDLEDELIRAVGPAIVEQVIERQGELAAFRTFQKQAAWRGRPINEQLRRFLGNSYRKIRYGRLLVEVLDLSRVPRPLNGVLAHALDSRPDR